MDIKVESDHVHKVYSKIAVHFSDTRFKPWPRIAQFLREQAVGSLIADVGCGNGKYLGVNPSTFCLGSDICPELVSIACDRGHEVAVCDCLQLPYLSITFDAVICIAVVHHLSNEDRRLSALREMARILRPGGHMLVYVWAMEQERKKFDSQDVMVPWHMQPKYIPGASQALDSVTPPKKRSRDNAQAREKKRQIKEQKRQQKSKSKKRASESEHLCRNEGTGNERATNDSEAATCSLGELSALDLSDEDLGPMSQTESKENIPTNPESCAPLIVSSTEATGDCVSQGPPLVCDPHKSPIVGNNKQSRDGLEGKGYQTFQRYYHVFRHGELVELFSKLEGVKVVEEFFDHENWCVIARKE